MENIVIWKTHPIFDLYQGSTEGRVRHIQTGRLVNPATVNMRYHRVRVRGATTKYRSLYVHRFIYSCFNEDFDIRSALHIDHIDDEPTNNRLTNLQALPIEDNNRKAQRNRDMQKIRGGRVMNILAENMETGERRLFRSKYQCARFFGKSSAMVYLVLNKIKGCKYLLQAGVRWEIREPTQEELEALPFSTLESVQST
jgi:hypothetical protein